MMMIMMTCLSWPVMSGARILQSPISLKFGHFDSFVDLSYSDFLPTGPQFLAMGNLLTSIQS